MFRPKLLLAALPAVLLATILAAPAQAADNQTPGNYPEWVPFQPGDPIDQEPARLVIYTRVGKPAVSDLQWVISYPSYGWGFGCSGNTFKVKTLNGNWTSLPAGMRSETVCNLDQFETKINNLPKNSQVRIILPLVWNLPSDRPVVPDYYEVYTVENDYIDFWEPANRTEGSFGYKRLYY